MSSREKLKRQLIEPEPEPPASGMITTLADADKGSLPLLVLVHPVGGGLLSYRKLVESLRGEFLVVGIAAQLRILEQLDGAGLSALATTYNLELRRLGFDQPEVVAGWSHGGLIAWEMAHLMFEESKLQTPSVALFDSGCVDRVDLPMPSVEEFTEYFVEDLARSNGIEAEDSLGLGELADQLGLDDSLVDELRQIFHFNSRAYWRHEPTRSALPATFIITDPTDSTPSKFGVSVDDVVHCADEDHYSLISTAHGVSCCADAVRRANGLVQTDRVEC